MRKAEWLISAILREINQLEGVKRNAKEAVILSEAKDLCIPASLTLSAELSTASPQSSRHETLLMADSCSSRPALDNTRFGICQHRTALCSAWPLDSSRNLVAAIPLI
ncbi:MAG: hypothetical protein WCF68_18550 [Terriglobales bacterium]